VNSIKSINFNFGTVQLLDNTIIRLEMFDNVTIGVDECRLLNNAIGELSNSKQSLILMVPNNGTHFTPESRTFSASEEGLRYTIADAMVVQNLAQKLIVSFYLKVNKPPKPSKAFSSEEEAVSWLLSFNT
jgi:hypothetical protein